MAKVQVDSGVVVNNINIYGTGGVECKDVDCSDYVNTIAPETYPVLETFLGVIEAEKPKLHKEFIAAVANINTFNSANKERAKNKIYLYPGGVIRGYGLESTLTYFGFESVLKELTQVYEIDSVKFTKSIKNFKEFLIEDSEGEVLVKKGKMVNKFKADIQGAYLLESPDYELSYKLQSDKLPLLHEFVDKSCTQAKQALVDFNHIFVVNDNFHVGLVTEQNEYFNLTGCISFEAINFLKKAKKTEITFGDCFATASVVEGVTFLVGWEKIDQGVAPYHKLIYEKEFQQVGLWDSVYPELITSIVALGDSHVYISEEGISSESVETETNLEFKLQKTLKFPVTNLTKLQKVFKGLGGVKISLGEGKDKISKKITPLLKVESEEIGLTVVFPCEEVKSEG